MHPLSARGGSRHGSRSQWAEALRRRWEKATNWPLMIAAVIFLATYALPVLAPDLPTWLLGCVNG